MLRVFILCALAVTSYAATCGGDKFFEYKFTPLEVRPVNDEDAENAHGRCGSMEKHCEVMIQLYGGDKCAKDKKDKTNEGIQLIAPPDKNVVKGSEFNPSSVGYSTHSSWKLSGAKEQPFRVQVCDKDPFLRGGNDQIIDAQFQDLVPGCKEMRHQDDDEKNPWVIRYELCCRPISKKGSGGSRVSSATGSFGGSSTHKFKSDNSWIKDRPSYADTAAGKSIAERVKARHRHPEKFYDAKSTFSGYRF